MLLITANVCGPSEGKGTAERRKQAISGLLTDICPHLIMLQEFQWKDINGSCWKNFCIPSYYEYEGNRQASIIYNKNELMVKKIKESSLIQIFEEMIRMNKLPMGFTPLPRMCAVLVETKGVPYAQFLCVSWHGYWKKGNEKKLKDFLHIQIYVKQIAHKNGLQFVIAGDFNIPYQEACKVLLSTVDIYKYSPPRNRKGKLIDFFVTSKELRLNDVAAIDWQIINNCQNTFKVFDHVPVTASLVNSGQPPVHI